MNLQGKIEAIIYAAEEPVTLDQLATLLKRDVLAELEAQASATASLGFAQDGAETVADQVELDDVPPEATTETASGSEPPSEARELAERAPESQEPLSVP